jgi:CBS domain containing-hemolysin-like protein
MDHWILWPVFVFLNGGAAAIALVSGTVGALSHAELEDLRRRDAKAAVSLERSRGDQGNTLAAFEVLIAAFVGMSALLGGILGGARILPGVLAGGLSLTLGLTVLAIIAVSFFMAWLTVMLPRKVGIHFRITLAPRIAPMLSLVRGAASILRSFGKLHDSLAPPVEPGVDQADADIGSFAQAAAREGKITQAESNLVANAVRLDDIPVSQVLTPRPVVTALEADLTVADVLRLYPNVPHGRMPVWEKNPDRIIGLVRRRDLLKAAGEDRHTVTVRELMGKAHIVPENATLADALHDLVRNHQQLAVVVDEFGAFSGVVTLEDVFESLLGIEIYEKDDPHPDMRELARQRGHRLRQDRRGREPRQRVR